MNPQKHMIHMVHQVVIKDSALFRDLQTLGILFRFKVSLMVVAAAGFAFVLLHPAPSYKLLFTLLGVMFLSASCSAWNQAQEAKTDAQMGRTKNRPVPQGRISKIKAVIYGTITFLPALAFLYIAQGQKLLLLAVLVVLVYNLAYTPLKKYTCFSLLIGAVAGASPVLFGWIAAGGSITDPALVLIYGTYLLWQIPHFWLRVEKHRKDYLQANLPAPPILFQPTVYKNILLLWFYGFCLTVLLIPVFSFVTSSFIRISITAISLLTLITGLMLLCKNNLYRVNKSSLKDYTTQLSIEHKCTYQEQALYHTKPVLLIVDICMLLVMLLLCIDAFWF